MLTHYIDVINSFSNPHGQTWKAFLHIKQSWNFPCHVNSLLSYSASLSAHVAAFDTHRAVQTSNSNATNTRYTYVSLLLFLLPFVHTQRLYTQGNSNYIRHENVSLARLTSYYCQESVIPNTTDEVAKICNMYCE